MLVGEEGKAEKLNNSQIYEGYDFSCTHSNVWILKFHVKFLLLTTTMNGR